MLNRNANILLVEDNFGDAHLTCLMLKESRAHCQMHVIDNGADAMDFLLQQGKYDTVPRPDLILMDLNLPKIDGRQLLKDIKSHPKLRQIPVMILTSSEAEEDIFVSYDNGANCYLRKPMGLDEFGVLTKRIEDFWLDSALLACTKPLEPWQKMDDHARETSTPKLRKAI